MISVDEALERILGSVGPLGSETAALSEAAGRILAGDIGAQLFNPAFDVSAMDGYAVRAEDVRPGATLKMIGVSQAGAGFGGTVGVGVGQLPKPIHFSIPLSRMLGGISLVRSEAIKYFMIMGRMRGLTCLKPIHLKYQTSYLSPLDV